MCSWNLEIMLFLSPAFSKKGRGTLFSVFRGAWFPVCSRYLVSATPSSFRPILLKLYNCFNHGLKSCMCFLKSKSFFSSHF